MHRLGAAFCRVYQVADISDKRPLRVMEDVRALLAKNLLRLRHAAKLSQEELADRADINRGYMSDIENSRYNATILILAKLANALGVEPADLLKRDPP